MYRAKRILAVLLSAAMLIGITACGSSSSGLRRTKTNNRKKILFTLSDNMTGAKGEIEKAVRDAGKKAGYQVTVQTTSGNLDKQISQLEVAKSHGFGGIICWADDPDAALQLEIAAGDLPIVFLNSLPDDNALQEGSYVFVGSDDEQAGQYQAEYVYNTLGKPDKMNLLIMKGKKESRATFRKTNAARNYLKDHGVNVNIVFSDFADDDTDTTYNLLQKFSITGQKFDAAICNDDAMALGVVQYMQENGMSTSSIPVCGIDGTQAALSSIQSGGMSFTVRQPIDKLAQTAVSAVAGLQSGDGIKNLDGATKDGRYIWLPYEKVSADNVDKYMSK